MESLRTQYSEKKGGTKNFWPCFGRPKLGECHQMRSISKIIRCCKKNESPKIFEIASHLSSITSITTLKFSFHSTPPPSHITVLVIQITWVRAGSPREGGWGHKLPPPTFLLILSTLLIISEKFVQKVTLINQISDLRTFQIDKFRQFQAKNYLITFITRANKLFRVVKWPISNPI